MMNNYNNKEYKTTNDLNIGDIVMYANGAIGLVYTTVDKMFKTTELAIHSRYDNAWVIEKLYNFNSDFTHKSIPNLNIVRICPAASRSAFSLLKLFAHNKKVEHVNKYEWIYVNTKVMTLKQLNEFMIENHGFSVIIKSDDNNNVYNKNEKIDNSKITDKLEEFMKYYNVNENDVTHNKPILIIEE